MQRGGRTRIQLCGRLLVELEGRRVEDVLPSRQGRLLFAYLALNADRPVSRDELIDRMWPGRPPSDPMAALNTLVSRLRRALGAEVIQGRSQLSLVLPAGAEIDVSFAAEALTRARSAVECGDWPSAWGPAHAALAIASRGLLPGFEAEWIEARRRQLEEVELEALALVAEVGLGLGGTELAAADRAARVLVERVSLRESGHLLRMRVLAARGNVAEALQAYESLRRLLIEELGTTPSRELVALHERLVRGEAASHEGKGGFVGRRRELELLDRALAAARSQSRRAVLVAGDAGIGKTRLVEEFAHRAGDSGAEVLWGRCFEVERAPAFWPWVEVVRASMKARRADQVSRALGPGASDVAQIVPELTELLGKRAPLAPAAPEAARFRLFDSLSRFFERLAAARPLVVVLDDLQWGDAPSLELLEFVATRPDQAPILLIAVYRDTELAASHPLSRAVAKLTSEPRADRLELRGLDDRELASLVAAASGDAELDRSVLDAVRHRTAGNPFFIVELMRLLEDERGRADGRAESILRDQVPSSVRDVIRRRLGRVPESSVGLLSVAAVIGARFELDVLARASAMGEHDVPELLAPALRDAIVATEPGLAGQYAFSHALIREVLCGELEPMHAAAVHWQVARALEELYGDDERRLIELAHHSYEGAPAGDPDKAIGYALRAAEQARTRLAYEQAEQQLRRALELVERVRSRPERAARELEAQLQLGALLMMTMGYADPAVEETCRRAEQLCLQIGDEDRLLPSLWRLGVFYEVRAEFARQEAIGGRLMELANRSGDPNARLSAIMMLAPPAIHRGELKHAADLLKDAIRLADRCDPSGLVEAFGQNHQVTARGFLAWVGSLVDSERGETQLLVDEALRRARQVGSPLDEAFALFLDAFCAAIREDAARARRQASAVKALSLEHGFPVFCAMGTMIHGWAIAASADPESGCEALVRGLADFEATGARMLLHFYFALLADAQRRAGRLERALAAVEAGLSHVDASTRFYAAELHRLKGSLLVELRPESGSEAEEARRTAISIASEQNARTLERRANAGLARR